MNSKRSIPHTNAPRTTPRTVSYSRRDLVTGDHLLIDLPVERHPAKTGPLCVSINIRLDAYQRLVEWASIGRTIRNAINELDTAAIDNDNALIARDELQQLLETLASIHASIRQHWQDLYRQQHPILPKQTK